MKTRLSGLVDGELDARDAQVVLEAVKRDAELRERWHHYLLIGDALRGGGTLHRDITGQVMAALEDEPVVLAPRRRQEWPRTVLALAASVAGVALVSWVALGPRNEENPPAPELAAAAAPMQVSAQAPAQPAAGDMQEYLAAHQAQAGSLRFRGGTENIRTVAVRGGVPAR